MASDMRRLRKTLTYLLTYLVRMHQRHKNDYKWKQRVSEVKFILVKHWHIVNSSD